MKSFPGFVVESKVTLIEANNENEVTPISANKEETLIIEAKAYRVIKEDTVKYKDEEDYIELNSLIYDKDEFEKSIKLMIKYKWIEEI
jgi:hypothetical protein